MLTQTNASNRFTALLLRFSPGRIVDERLGDGLTTERLISCLSSGVFCSLLFLMAILMLPQDIAGLGHSHGEGLVNAHIVFRVASLLPLAWLIYRAIVKQTQVRDFVLLMVMGTLYSAEGSLFNLSYFLAYIEIMVAVAWFSMVPFRLLIWFLPLLSLLYSSLVFNIDAFQDVSRMAISDNIVAIWITTLGALVGASFRDYWQRLNAELVQKHIEDNSRLIDLGEQLGVIFHDVNNSLGLIQGNIELMRLNSSPNDKMRQSLERLSKATNHIIRLQQFVLGMSRDDQQDIQRLPAAELESTLRSLVLDMCPAARPFVRIVVQPGHWYRCSPSALSFALINAVNNSYQSFKGSQTFQDRHHHISSNNGYSYGDPLDQERIMSGFAIQIKVCKLEDGQTQIEVRDNGPGFPEAIMSSLFDKQLTTKAGKGHGLGLRNIKRYLAYQNGQVRGFNDNGAVIHMTIPG